MKWTKHWSREYSFWHGTAIIYGMPACFHEELGKKVNVRGEFINGWFSTYSQGSAKQKLFDYYSNKVEKDLPSIHKRISDLVNAGERFVSFTKSIVVQDTLTKNVDLLEKYHKEFSLFVTHLWKTFILVELVEKAFENEIRKRYSPQDVAQVILTLSQSSRKASMAQITDFFKKESDRKKQIHFLKQNFPWIGSRDPFVRPFQEKDFENFVDSFTITNQPKQKTKLSIENTNLLKTYQQMLWLKDKRDDLRREGFYYGFPLVQAIAGSMEIDLEDLSFLLPGEFLRDYLKLISERKKAVIVELHGKEVILRQGVDVVRELTKKEHISSINEVWGSVACSGKIQGRVQLILSKEDITRFTRGNVLVTPTTDPDHLPAMNKAIAFVTDEGGIACHAAIVARELGVPCIVGTKLATKIFKDGDVVEVDAIKGIVRKISK